MSYVVLSEKERADLKETFFTMQKKGEKYPQARTEVMTALRCLKAIHSNAIEDKRVDRIFLQVLLHDAGIENKDEISAHYSNAKKELKGQEEMLRWLEEMALKREEFSISMLLQMHQLVFKDSMPDSAGKFRPGDVRIKGMAHRPPHHSKIQELLFQHFANINDRLKSFKTVDRDNLFEILRLSAEVHFLVASVHPFEDGNGRIARAMGDYAMLFHGLYYDVIMTDYRDIYLDALEACTMVNSQPLQHFIEYSYLETLHRISGFYDLVDTK
jgi:Fic family protein